MKHTGKTAAALAAVMAFSMLPGMNAGAISPNIAEGTYSIHSRLDTGKVLSVEDGSLDNGGNICLAEADGSEEQLFNITKNGDSYTITSVSSGLAMEADASVWGAGANVRQWTADGLQPQQWRFEFTENGYLFIKSALGAYLGLEDESGADGSNVQTAKNKKSEALWWKLVKEEDHPRTNRIYIARDQDQTGLGACAAMLVRSELFLNGDVSWTDVTENTVARATEENKTNLKWNWKYTVPGGGLMEIGRKAAVNMNSNYLANILERSPSGVVIYCASADYAVLVTDYMDGVFYCADPLPENSGKLISLKESYLGQAIGNQAYILNSVTAYWTVSVYRK